MKFFVKIIVERVSSYLHGIVHYGENIEDEWFIVYLLLTFSKQCNDIFIRFVMF